MAVKTPLKVLNDYFNAGDGKRSVSDFAKEIKALNQVEKDELVAGVLAVTGDTLAPAK